MKYVTPVIAMTVLMFCGCYALAQQPKTESKPLPQLSTADKIAIQSLEKQKSDAATQWNAANNNELEVLSEWDTAHPGFHVYYNPTNSNDPQQLTIQTIQAQAPEKPTPPEQVKPSAPAKQEPKK